jgi:hypothetical protein
MEKDKPRWKPSYGKAASDVFLGYANDLDIWCDPITFGVYIIGPESRLIHADRRCNFDAFDIVDGNLIYRSGSQDLHIGVHDMCLVYVLCVEKGVLDGKG